jgi:peptidoglycan hydrolase FlgJ
MQTALVNHSHGAAGKAAMPTYNGRPDYTFAAALDKLSPQVKAKAQTQAQNFEGMFLNSMFSEMTNGLKGEGPFGSTTGTGIWRSMQIEQYSKSFAQAGGVGIAKHVYRTLVMREAQTVGQTQGSTQGNTQVNTQVNTQGTIQGKQA